MKFNFKLFYLVIPIFLYASQVKADNERYIRKLYSDKLLHPDDGKIEKKYSWIAESGFYLLDLNEGNYKERIQVIKKDGEDWIKITNLKGNKIFETKLDRSGRESWIYRLRLFQVAKNVKGLLIYYYMGNTKYLHFQGNSRIYILTWMNNELERAILYPGPYIWEEKEFFGRHYRQRFYQVKLKDVNNDGINEVAIYFNDTARVFFYIGQGIWKGL